MRNAFVTGGFGFIGTNLSASLADRGWNVFVVDLPAAMTEAKKQLFKDKGVRFRAISILDRENLYGQMMLFEPDVIFHLAAIPRVPESVANPFSTARTNVAGTVSVLECARDVQAAGSKIRVVYSSSSSIYGGADILPTPETAPANPKSPYALQKWEGEEWCRMFSSVYGLDTVCLRYFNVIGPWSIYGGAYSTVLTAWIHSLLGRSKTRPYLEGDGLQSRDFCHVGNVVNANILAGTCENLTFSGNAFNVAQGQSHTLIQVKQMLEKISGRQLDIEMRPPRIGDVRATQADISQAMQILGYSPATDFESQVAEMYEWSLASGALL